MSNHRDLAVLDAAVQVENEINRLIDDAPRALIHVGQLRDSAHSISSNIREGLGRGKGGERNRSFRTARGETEETIGHLQANFDAERIAQKIFWQLRNKLITIAKMLTSLLNS